MKKLCESFLIQEESCMKLLESTSSKKTVLLLGYLFTFLPIIVGLQSVVAQPGKREATTNKPRTHMEDKHSGASTGETHNMHGKGPRSSGRQVGRQFQLLDSNADGFLSREEAAVDPRAAIAKQSEAMESCLAEHGVTRPKLSELFDTLDVDDNGLLSREELLVGLQQHRPDPSSMRAAREACRPTA
jgi:hypothetical protein